VVPANYHKWGYIIEFCLQNCRPTFVLEMAPPSLIILRVVCDVNNKTPENTRTYRSNRTPSPQFMSSPRTREFSEFTPLSKVIIWQIAYAAITRKRFEIRHKSVLFNILVPKIGDLEWPWTALWPSLRIISHSVR